MSDIAPGWYKDPAEPTTQRYWDGEGWIGDAIPADAVPQATPPPATQQAAPPLAGPQAAHIPGVPQEALPPAVSLPPVPGAGFPYVLRPVPVPQPHGLALAPLSARFVARLIDILVVLVLNVIGNGWLVYQYVSDLMPVVREMQDRLIAGQAESAARVDIPTRVGWLQVAIVSVAAVLWFVYEVPSIASTGQTIGKRLMQIKVVRVESLDPLGLRRAWRRWNPLGLPSLFWGCYGFGFLLQGADLLSGVLDRPLHQAIHDKSAGTVVVRVPKDPATGK